MYNEEIASNTPHIVKAGPLRQQQISNQKEKIEMIDTRKEVQCMSFLSSIVGFLRINLCDQNKKIVGGLYGSGVLITPKIVLTCAHNFFPPTNQYVITKENIKFNQHVGNEYSIDSYQLSPSYSLQESGKEANEAHDFAIINLTNYSICKEICQLKCFWDVNRFKEMIRDHDNIEIKMFGYPSDKNIKKLKKEDKKITQRNIIGYQFKSSGNLIAFDDHFLWHNMASQAGQSGSPIFYTNGLSHYLIGIHKGYNLQKKQYYGIPLWSMKPFLKDYFGKDTEAFS